jgi:hypothetical protein
MNIYRKYINKNYEINKMDQIVNERRELECISFGILMANGREKYLFSFSSLFLPSRLSENVGDIFYDKKNLYC